MTDFAEKVAKDAGYAPRIGVQEPPGDPRIFNRRQKDGAHRPISEFFEPAEDAAALKKKWDKLSKLAAQHKEAGERFNRAAEEYYGVEWKWLSSIADHDPIIDTIDYGTDSLTFEEFDDLVRSAMKSQAEQAGST